MLHNWDHVRGPHRQPGAGLVTDRKLQEEAVKQNQNNIKMSLLEQQKKDELD
jgi:hypothetical protein